MSCGPALWRKLRAEDGPEARDLGQISCLPCLRGKIGYQHPGFMAGREHSLGGHLFYLKIPRIPLPSGLLRRLSQKKGTFPIVPLTGDLPGFQEGPAGPQGGGELVQKAAPVRRRGKWAPLVPVLPSLPPAGGSSPPERPVPWSAPGKEMDERSALLQRAC